MTVCGGESFHRSSRKADVNCAQRRRWKGRRVAREDDSLCDRPKGMLMGCRRSRGGVRLRLVSGIRGEGGGVLLMEAEASGALVLEAVGRAKICLARFILRHVVAAVSSILCFKRIRSNRDR